MNNLCIWLEVISHTLENRAPYQQPKACKERRSEFHEFLSSKYAKHIKNAQLEFGPSPPTRRAGLRDVLILIPINICRIINQIEVNRPTTQLYVFISRPKTRQISLEC